MSMGYFEKSIEFSRKGKYLHEEAIAFEEYGMLHFDNGQIVIGENMIVCAYDLFVEWGAILKAAELKSK